MTPPPSDHFNGKTFHNPSGRALHGWADLLRWKLSSRPTPWPKRVEVGPAALPAAPRGDGIAVTWIGQSTFLLQTSQGNFLTDPVFSKRAGPLGLLGPRRTVAPGIPLDGLPRIDAVLLSHDHYDHCDLPSLRCLAAAWAPPVVAPLGHAGLLTGAGAAAAVKELDWWESADLGNGVRVTLVPARHWCRRSLGTTNVRLWGGFVLQAGARRLYFVGDTGYDETLFVRIAERCGAPDLALIPIGAYEPRWFMQGNHVNPAEAVRLHRDVGSRRSIAMHWGTFRLTDEGRDDPPRDLASAADRAGLAPGEFMVLQPGGSLAL